ncbi:hypothetical protein STANM309S_04043 [Streptomyces tanashiensis]
MLAFMADRRATRTTAFIRSAARGTPIRSITAA